MEYGTQGQGIKERNWKIGKPYKNVILAIIDLEIIKLPQREDQNWQTWETNDEQRTNNR